VASDQDATSSSTSSSSGAINNSSTSLSLSPAGNANSQSTSTFGEIQQQLSHGQQKNAFRFENNINAGLKTGIDQTKQISKHLLELQREIKEEEDEIFADINSLINDRSNLYSWSFDAEEEDDFEENGAVCAGLVVNPSRSTSSPPSSDLNQHGPSATSPQKISPLLRRQKPITPPSPPAPAEVTDTLALQETALLDDTDDYIDHQDGHEDQFQFSLLDQHQGEDQFEEQQEIDEQEPKQLQSEQSLQEALQQQQRDIQELTSNLPKPCVFFLEGNCRRSDCKFSHDLSSIICKYWIEGFCFKGEMCPFSHSLTSLGPSNGHDTGLSDVQSRSHLSEKQLNPTFVIESEADFPSLPLDAPPSLNGILGDGAQLKNTKQGALTRTIKNQILSSNPTVVFKTTKKKRKKG